MSETLKQISAPVLNENYGANIVETFNNINSNFGVVANKDLVKGDAGNSIMKFSISWNTLLTGDTLIDDHDYEYTLNPQRINILYALVEEFGCDLDDPDDPIYVHCNYVLNYLETETTPNIVVCFLESNRNDLLYVFPITLLDPSFNDENNLQHPELLDGIIDVSNVLYYSESSWLVSQPFPTLYYDTVKNTLCWKINTQDTQLPAQGPQGTAGEDAKSWIGQFNYDGQDGLQTIDKVLINDDWSSDLSNLKTGDVIIMIPDNQLPDPPNQYGYKYWISTVYVDVNNPDDPTYKAFCGSDNWRWAYLNDYAFRDIMSRIDPDGVNKGYFIPNGQQGAGFLICAPDNSQRNLHVKYIVPTTPVLSSFTISYDDTYPGPGVQYFASMDIDSQQLSVGKIVYAVGFESYKSKVIGVEERSFLTETPLSDPVDDGNLSGSHIYIMDPTDMTMTVDGRIDVEEGITSNGDIIVQDSSVKIDGKLENGMFDYQVAITEGGMTDAALIYMNREGILTGILSIPTRYLHASTSVFNKKDLDATIDLAVEVIKKMI